MRLLMISLKDMNAVRRDDEAELVRQFAPTQGGLGLEISLVRTPCRKHLVASTFPNLMAVLFVVALNP